MTQRPREDLVKWTNPRAPGRTVEVDRGLDPSWAGNPGKDRPRMLAEIHAAGIEEIAKLAPAAAREAIRQAVDGSLLERQLAAPGDSGPLPVGWLEPGLRRHLAAGSSVIRLDRRAATHLAGKHADITAAVMRAVLPGLLRNPALALRSGRGLALFGRDASGVVYKVAVHARRGRPRLATLHRSSAMNAEALLAGGAEIAEGSMAALGSAGS